MDNEGSLLVEHRCEYWNGIWVDTLRQIVAHTLYIDEVSLQYEFVCAWKIVLQIMVLYILMVDTDFICIEYEISRARNKNTFLVAVVYETFFRNYHRCDSEYPCVKNARVVTFDRYY